jgi:uncharacterized Ntn-hydrolase superfamily protein
VALVVTQTVGGDRRGVAAAAVALRLRVPLVLAMAVAAVVTALVRHLT